MMTLKTNRYLTKAQQRRAERLLRRHAGVHPPYTGISEKDATLMHAAKTGFHPLAARNSVRRSRGQGSGEDVVDLATLSLKERSALPF